jgi:hypothetical protein
VNARIILKRKEADGRVGRCVVDSGGSSQQLLVDLRIGKKQRADIIKGGGECDQMCD